MTCVSRSQRPSWMWWPAAQGIVLSLPAGPTPPCEKAAVSTSGMGTVLPTHKRLSACGERSSKFEDLDNIDINSRAV